MSATFAPCLVLAVAVACTPSGRPAGRPAAEAGAGEVAAGQRAPSACQPDEDAWLAKRRATVAFPEDLLPVQRIGDCWVAAADLERARAFYRTVKADFADRVCDTEGVACGIAASEELRRIDCGSSWLAPSAEVAWRDFLGALDRDATDPTSLRIEPDVREWVPGERQLAEACGASAFALPASVRLDREDVRGQLLSGTAPWSDRSAVVPIRAEDVPWKNHPPGIYRFFRLRACGSDRPVPGAASGFAIRVVPVEAENVDPPCSSR